MGAATPSAGGDFTAAIDRFLAHLAAERGASPLTRKAYREDLLQLEEFLRSAGCRRPADATSAILRRFAAGLNAAGYAASTVARKLASMRSFFTFGQREGWVRANPAKPGETGSWRIEGGRIIIDFTSGWRDEIIPAADAFSAKNADDPEAPFIESDDFVQESWAPGADRAKAPSNGGRAVKLKGAWINWVGLWAEAGSSRTWAFQSDNLVFGGEGNPAMGLWHVHADRVTVQWADARRSDLRVKGDHVEVTTVKADGTTTVGRLDRLR